MMLTTDETTYHRATLRHIETVCRDTRDNTSLRIIDSQELAHTILSIINERGGG